MHVCFISQEYPPETGWGGIGSYVHDMAHGLTRAGHRVTVIARAANRESTADDAGVTVHRLLPSPDWNRYRGCWRLNGYWPGFAWAAAHRLRDLHRRSAFDLVEAAEIRADSLPVSMWPFSPPVIIRLHLASRFVDKASSIEPDRKKRLTYWEEQQVIRRADMVTAPSRAIVNLTNTWVSIGAHRVVPNPVDVALFSPTERSESGEVLFVGRLEEKKGLVCLAEAIPDVLRRCRHASFRFAGSDGLDAQGRSWRVRLLEAAGPQGQDRVHFATVPRHDLPACYGRADVCVLPSNWENFPYALLEAMACGRPAVATSVGGVPEMVRNGETGLLVSVGDPRRLADAICTLLEDRSAREAMGARARAVVEAEFSVERVVPAMLTVYREVIGGKACRDA